jgi:hypothetical protein
MGEAKGFGNIHSADIMTILNRMHETILFRLHAEDRLPSYRHLLDPRIFGESIDHVCTLQIALTRLAMRMEDGGIDPTDTRSIEHLNKEIARSMGMELDPNAPDP